MPKSALVKLGWIVMDIMAWFTTASSYYLASQSCSLPYFTNPKSIRQVWHTPHQRQPHHLLNKHTHSSLMGLFWHITGSPGYELAGCGRWPQRTWRKTAAGLSARLIDLKIIIFQYFRESKLLCESWRNMTQQLQMSLLHNERGWVSQILHPWHGNNLNHTLWILMNWWSPNSFFKHLWQSLRVHNLWPNQLNLFPYF